MTVLTGAETYQRLTPDQRERFDVEWRWALAVATRDFDVEPLVLMVCRWWVAAGGGEAVARATRGAFDERSRRCVVEGSFTSGGPTVPLRGPEVFAALPGPEQVRMEEAWHAAIVEARESRDTGALAGVVLVWWVELQTTPADRDALAEETRAVEAAVSAGDLVGLSVWSPAA